MANYKKSFSFRHGVQVDNDNFIVNTNGLVGIGTTTPTKHLDVRGSASISGLLTASGYNSSGVSTFQNDVNVGTGITFDASTNTIIAPNIKIGTSPSINNVVGYSTVGWIVNATAYGISTSLNVGIHTDASVDYVLTIGGNPSIEGENGIGVTGGNIKATGIVSASSFDGTVNVNDLDGIIGNDHIPDIVTSNINISSGISTFSEVKTSSLTVTGTLTGTASTAQGLTGTPDITVGVTTVSRLKVTNIGVETESPEQPIQVGIATTENDNVCVITKGTIGIGTTNPSEELEIYNRSNARVKLTSGENNKSTVTVGVATTATNRKGELQYDSSTDVLTLKNHSGKSIRLDVIGDDGKLIVRSNSSRVFGITNEGRVSIKKSSDPETGFALDVNGAAKIGGGSSVTGSLTIDSDGTPFELTGGSQKFPIDPNQNLNSTSGVSTFKELHILGNTAYNGINVSGSGIGKTVAIGSVTTLFDNTSASIGVSCFINEDITINKDIRIGTGTTYTDEIDNSELKLIVNQTAEFNRKVSFASTVTGITTTLTSVGIGTTQNDPVTGIGTTAKVSFDVPDWARGTRVSFTKLSTGLDQPGFRFVVNDLLNNYEGNTWIQFPNSGGTESNPHPSLRVNWEDGCFIGIEAGFLGGNTFGKYMSASGYVEFSVLDPYLDFPQVMVNGIVDLQSTSGILTHFAQATLSGYITLDGGTNLSSVSVGAGVTGVLGNNNTFLHVGIPTDSNTYTTPAYVNATHFR